MNLFRLNFTQKIWLGFVIIIVLLSMSSVLSLFNLNDIDSSTTRVNEQAVPVQKQSNLVQIALLKQAKLSSSGYNAINSTQINEFMTEYNQGSLAFEKLYNDLRGLVKSNKKMADYTEASNTFYKNYHEAVIAMFSAKLELLNAQEKADQELEALSLLVDDTGALLLEVSYFESKKDAKTIELVAGVAGRIDGQLIGLYNQLKEINNQVDASKLETGTDDLAFALSDMQTRIDYAGQLLEQVDVGDLWTDYLTKMEELKERATQEQNIVYFKTIQLEKTATARAQLETAEAEVEKVVEQFDNLLFAADTQFNEQQKEVLSSVTLGNRSVSIAWIVLIILAWQNFNSMRISIKKKMADLAKLNSTGESLASTQDKNRALEEVLAAMHEQVGVAQGSVYLTNDDNKLELKAYYPPKTIDPDSKPKIFEIGEGILGKSAEKQKIIFVPDTSSDNKFVDRSMGDTARALLCVPLVDKDVLIGVMNFSGNVKTVRFEDSDYEFASSIARSLVTTIKNIRMREVIEEQNRTLEQKVRERTAELAQKNKDIAIMMENLHQGVFTIIDGGIIHPEYSAYLEEILGTNKIANHHFMDQIFTHTNLGADSLNQISTAVDSLLGMDEMMFEFNAHLLVSEVVRNAPNQTEKILEFDWAPIVNQTTDEIEKILVTVRDVTELKALQKEAEAQKRELEIIGQILSVDNEKFRSFVSSSHDFIGKCRTIIQQTKEKDLDVIATLFRNMHTVKGNARTYGFTSVTDSVHQVESTYDELRKQPDKPWDSELLLEELNLAEQDIIKFENIAKQKLNIHQDQNSADVVDRERVAQLIESALNMDVTEASSTVKNWVHNAYSLLVTTQAKPISSVIKGVINSVNSLAEELDKIPPDIEVDENDLYIKREAHEMLNNVFMHVFRNAIDHGIEQPDIRKSKNKPEKGLIQMKAYIDHGTLNFEVKDDGKGLALDRIYQAALDKGIYNEGDPRPSAHEIANLVFASGFSTAERVTEVSGRGVGMDAVKNFLEQHQGGIEIILDEGDSSDFRSFTTHIKLSGEFAVTLPC